MKQILNFFKTLFNGILTAVAGGYMAWDLMYIINNCKKIAEESGWPVVKYFTLTLVGLVLFIYLWYELGIIASNSKKWIKYKRSMSADTISDSSCDCDASDEAADTTCDCE